MSGGPMGAMFIVNAEDDVPIGAKFAQDAFQEAGQMIPAAVIPHMRKNREGSEKGKEMKITKHTIVIYVGESL